MHTWDVNVWMLNTTPLILYGTRGNQADEIASWGSITHLTERTCLLGSHYPSERCLDGNRKRDELGLDSRSGSGPVASTRKEGHPLIHIGGNTRDGAG